MKLHLLPLGVALAVCTATPLTAQTLTTWNSPVNVTASAGTLTKSGGCNGCPDSGAQSTIQLSGDGYAEFVPATGASLTAGLGNDLSASTSASTINYVFGIWPDGGFDIRELGVYKAEGTFVAGDRLRVAVENGVVVYRKNGTVVYTSKVAPAYPLVLDVTLDSTGASISGATLFSGTSSTTSGSGSTSGSGGSSSGGSGTTSGGTTTTGSPVRTAVGPYLAVIDRNTYTKPALPALGPAGTSITDPVFQSTITRITDGATRPGSPNYSYRTPSSSHQNAWSAAGTYFYVTTDDGTAVPFKFDATTGHASRINPTTTGSGGLTIATYIEPEFSYVNDSIMYGSYNGPGSNLHTIDQYDFNTGVYTRLLDLETVVTGLSGTYIGALESSDGPNERIMTFFGGTSQDHHHYVLVFDKANPSNRFLVDTWASTINGQPTPVTLNFSLHAVNIDLSGRYVMLYTTSADQTSTRKAPQAYLWDTAAGTFFAMTPAVHPYGHDAFGYGVMVNQDCCDTTTWDGVQWEFRSMATPAISRDVLTTVLQPQEVYVEDHGSWNSARPDVLVPYISAIFRYGTQNGAWRALDDEIVAVQTDAPGQDPTIWRFAHHRTDVSYDGDATRVSFWYEPRANVSRDGHWAIFTSNWEKTLGTDPAGDAGTGARQDVFLVKFDAANATVTPPPPPPPPPPTVVPVAIGTTTLPSGRATVAYSATLQATGGNGTYAWSVTNGTLPAGLSLNASSGAVTGAPQAAGTSTFTVAVADPTNTSNTTSAAMTIVVGSAPLAITSASLPGGRVNVAYSAGLQTAGGSGTNVWSVASGALPGGVSLNASSGALSGTPTTAGTFAFSATVTDGTDSSNSATAALSVTIAPATVPVVIAATALPIGRVDVAYSAAESASGGSGSFTWNVSSGALPSGLTLDASAGTISGTPTVTGTFAVTVTATDKADSTNSANAAYSLTISSGVKITSPRTLPSATHNVAYSYQVLASNVVGTAKWALAGGSMPPGITLNAATGVVSGTCTKAGTWYFNVRVTDVNSDNTLTLGLTVK